MVISNNWNFFTSSFCALLMLFSFLPGCSYKQEKKAIKPLSSESADFTHTKQNITIRAKKLNSKELVQLFGSKAKNLHIRKRKSKYHRNRKIVDVHALQLSITNNSLQPIYLNKKQVDLNLVECKRIAYALQKNIFLGPTATKITGITGLSLIAAGAAFALSGLTAAPACPCCILLPIYIGVALATPGVFFTCTSAVGHFQRKNAENKNTHIFSDLLQKNIGNKLMVNPGDTKSILLFVDKENYKKQFDLTVVNKTQSKNTFTVSL